MQELRLFHLAGIVPVAQPKLDFNMPWEDALMPIGANYTAVERAVQECAAVGCSTIWVVATHGTQVLLRKKIGDYVADPLRHLNDWKNRYREVSVFYISINERDKELRNSLPWSIVYGAHIARLTVLKLSRWIVPHKFYCAFPHSIMPLDTLMNNRWLIDSTRKTVFSYNGLTVKDNLQISFTFSKEDFRRAAKIVKQHEIDSWQYRVKPEPVNYRLDQVFHSMDTEDPTIIELPWHYEIDSWDKYAKYLGSEHAKTVKRFEYDSIRRPRFPQKKLYKIPKINRENIIDRPNYEDLEDDESEQ